MALWEYKVITSGPHGFASPALLEAHLNALGKDEWEIIHFQTLQNNSLAFHGLARRSTTRDWTPPIETVAAPPKPSYEPAPAPVKPAAPVAAAAKPEQETLVSRLEEKAEMPEPSRDAALRPMRDTERDLDPDAEEEEDDWDSWEEEEDELPTFFEAMKPHLRRNQKGPGMSVAVDYLAKRWEQREADLVGALKECGFTLPETEESDPEYFEFEGDLYWINKNNRGQLFINTREKPRPVFRTTQAKKLSPEDPAALELAAERAAEKAEIEKRRNEKAERQAAAAAAREQNQGPAVADQPDSPGTENGGEAPSKEPAGPLPAGAALLEKIRPMMRRNRRGPGYSGSVSYLARGLRHPEAELTAALAALGLNTPATPNEKPVYVEIGDGVYWMNKDSRGGIWINGREKREGGQRGERQGPGGTEAAAAPQGQPTERGEATSAPAPQGAPDDAAAPAPAGGSSAEGAPAPTPETAGSVEPAGEPVTPMITRDPEAHLIPDREISARPAEVAEAAATPESGASAPASESSPEATTSEGAAPDSGEAAAGESAPGDAPADGGERAAKPKGGRRPSRSRSRKPKAEAGEAESAVVSEDDVAKTDEPAPKPEDSQQA